MGNFAKWIGGGLGWVVGGPIGGLLGFLVGSFFDNTINPDINHFRHYQDNSRSFGMSLLVLIAAVMKADGKVVKSELDYVKQFFIRQFGHETAKEALVMLRDLLKKDIPVRDVCYADKQKYGLFLPFAVFISCLVYPVPIADFILQK